ncbi:unannotated protein [freshwater metagenome]|uniref:Unannotated protein n=1 Tax=freshwater metagenome TaxID=449393 RepID=A0A6J7VVL5_9ZZZZ
MAIKIATGFTASFNTYAPLAVPDAGAVILLSMTGKF